MASIMFFGTEGYRFESYRACCSKPLSIKGFSFGPKHLPTRKYPFFAQVGQKWVSRVGFGDIFQHRTLNHLGLAQIVWLDG